MFLPDVLKKWKKDQDLFETSSGLSNIRGLETIKHAFASDIAHQSTRACELLPEIFSHQFDSLITEFWRMEIHRQKFHL